MCDCICITPSFQILHSSPRPPFQHTMASLFEGTRIGPWILRVVHDAGGGGFSSQMLPMLLILKGVLPRKRTDPLKMLVGREVSFWNGPFSGDILNVQGEIIRYHPENHRILYPSCRWQSYNINFQIQKSFSFGDGNQCHSLPIPGQLLHLSGCIYS